MQLRSSVHTVGSRDCAVTGVASYGLFVAIMPGCESLVHVSELELGRAETDGWSVGDKIDVKVLEVRTPLTSWQPGCHCSCVGTLLWC